MLLRELDDCAVVSKLNARPASVTQHQSQRTLEHRLIRNLIGSFCINRQILPHCDRVVLCAGEELLHLFAIDWLGFR